LCKVKTPVRSWSTLSALSVIVSIGTAYEPVIAQTTPVPSEEATSGESPWWLDSTQAPDGVPLEETGEPVGQSRALGTGTTAGTVGAVNAIEADGVEASNASVSNRVGSIAAYKAGLEELSGIKMKLESARAALKLMSPPARETSEIREELGVARADVQRLQADILVLDDALIEAGGSDPQIEAQLAGAQTELSVARVKRNAVRRELDVAFDYQDAVAEVGELEAAFTVSNSEAWELLEAAANKSLNEDEIAEVNRLLGLEDVLLIPEAPGEVANTE